MTPRGSLFRKYVAYFVALVCVALIASGLVGMYFTYQENKAALLNLQREKAAAAASRIEAYVQEIERQLGWMRLPQIGAASIDQRRIEYLKLLRQVPAITEVSLLDSRGRERLRVSRLGMDVVASGADFSSDPKFTGTKSGRTYFSTVYFRKETEPYMTIAVAGASEETGVTVAEVNLKFIWDVISRIKIGDKGLAYVVDSRGQLIAHPDISQVLQKSDLSALPQVKAAREALAGDDTERVTISRDLKGQDVLTAHTAITPLGWYVFAEQPLSEAFAPLYASLVRTGLLLIAGLMLAVAASLYLARRMVTPIQTIQAGAVRIATGRLDQRIAVKTGDELEALAGEFNNMAKQLQESYSGLEHKVEERTRELSESLEHQTATGEILRVISRSPTDQQPVFEAIVKSGHRLFNGSNVSVAVVKEGQIHHPAFEGDAANREAIRHHYPAPLDRRGLSGLTILERRGFHYADVGAEEVPELARRIAREAGVRSAMTAPMLKEGEAIGAIVVSGNPPNGFTDKQVALLDTFADQAVIAIENARLFHELRDSLEHQTAVGELLEVISRTSFDLDSVLERLTQTATRLCGADQCTIFRPDSEGQYRPSVNYGYDKVPEALAALTSHPVRAGRDSATGRAILEARPIHIHDVGRDSEYQRSDVQNLLGFATLLAVPMVRDGESIGVITMTRGPEPNPFTEKQLELVTTLADQAVIAIENVRLFNEIQDKSRQLEIANRHKSEFLANMSHELRTPLNAIIGFSEMLIEQMPGELNEKQLQYMKHIHGSGEHLLSLINDILDLSKIEAGRMELDLARFALPAAIDNALTLVRERAERHGIALSRSVDERLGAFTADERKLKQILLNLLSNAVKFTPEGGKIGVHARQLDGYVEISVSDTGVGIAPEDQSAVFEEFRQVGRDYTRKSEGTGLGLALVRKFVELHGGALRLESAPGKGSTFTFTLPVREQAPTQT